MCKSNFEPMTKPANKPRKPLKGQRNRLDKASRKQAKQLRQQRQAGRGAVLDGNNITTTMSDCVFV